MEINQDNIVQNLSKKNKLYLPVPELDKILSFSEIKYEKNTLISDYIRIVKIDDKIVVQEKTDKNEIALHLFENEQDAEKFVKERLDTYEKMWDGCGCKVKYYDK
jgi:hypothetical protein